MKLFVLIILFCGSVISSLGQEQPVNWTFTAKKIANNNFELHILAKIDPGWHIYAQKQPENAAGIPTEFAFTKNPIAVFKGKVKEIGKMKRHNYEDLKIVQNEYDNEVEFVQQVILRAKVKTKISGNLNFQACREKKCLLPEVLPFSIALN